MTISKNAESGFTLVEMITVIVIIGILAAFAIPSFLNQRSKALEAEAKLNIGNINNLQQLYYHENLRFSTNFSELGLDPNNNSIYRYYIEQPEPKVISIIAEPWINIRGFVGTVYKNSAYDLNSKLCEGNINEIPECNPGEE